MRHLSIKNWYTKNGSRVLFVKKTENPMLEINAIFSSGSAHDHEKNGISQLTNTMLLQGTKKLNADQIAKKFEENGVKYHENSNRDSSIITIRSLTNSQYLEPALSLFSKILSAPNFPKKAFTNMQTLVNGAIEKQQQTPEFIAKKKFFDAIYPNHPYRKPVLGTHKSIAQLTTKDLKEFYAKYYVAKNLILTMVGNIPQKKAEHIADQLTRHLSAGKIAMKASHAHSIEKAAEYYIEYPFEQTQILIGQLGISQKDPNYFPAIVGNYILGGDPFISRLFSTVRVKYGLAYGISSQITTLAGRGQFFISFKTRNSAAKEALKITRNLVDDFVLKGPKKSELLAAKQKITNGFPLLLSTNQDIAHALNTIGFYDLPLDYLDNYCAQVNAVTPKQIKETFQTYFPPEKMVTVLVGRKISH